MGELSNSIAEAIKKRAVSATFGTYLFFWAAIHWQGIYTTLFTSQELIQKKYGMLKNEYVNEYFFGWNGIVTVVGYLIPLLLTIIFIWPLPKFVMIHAYRLEQRHKVDRRRVKIEEEERLLELKENLAKQTEKTLKAEIETSKKEQQAAKLDPKILWDKEYRSFSASGLVNYFPEIAEAVYSHGGRAQKYFSEVDGEWVGLNVDKDGLAIAHTNDLIDIVNGSISLTEKGKYFLSKTYFDRLP